MAGRKTIKSAIESMMFIWGEPLGIGEMAEVFNEDKNEIYACCKELQEEYEREGRGIMIREVNKSFQFVTRKENLGYVERLCTPVKRRRLTQSALEVLAIVAYRQPVTKGEIEAVRGIKCDRVIEGLEKKGLVAELGRSDAVGRPILYGTTDAFLKQFGFESLKELPDIGDIEGLAEEDGQAVMDMEGIYAQQISLELNPEKPESQDEDGE